MINKIIYFFGESVKWFVFMFERISSLMNNNPLLKEIMTFISYFILIFIAFGLIFWLTGKYTGEN